MTSLHLVLLPFVALPLLAAAPSAQVFCTGPDGLDGPCCSFALENLPAFPPLSMQGSALAWESCAPLPEVNLGMTLGAPTYVTCGVYTASFTAKDAAGISLVGGTLELVYSRTWEETDPAGLPYQVWRFLVKGDLASGPVPLPPPVAPADAPSFYHGYVDYALTCQTATPTWEHAFVLFHNCDAFLHGPGISAVPGVFDPTRTFAFVAPDTVAQPFDHTAIAAVPAGPATVGGLRDGVPPGVACRVRDQVLQGTLFPFVSGCACPLDATLPPRNTAVRMGAFGACGGGALSLDTASLGFPWLELVATSIGKWTSPLSYPGEEEASVHEGAVVWQDGCSLQRYAELHYGASTVGGWTRFAPAGAAPDQSLWDSCSNWSVPIPGPLSFPLVGLVFVPPYERHVLHLDLP